MNITNKDIKRVKDFYHNKRVYRQLKTMVSFLIPHRSDVKLSLTLGEDSYTDGKSITIGLPHIFVKKSLEEIFTALRAIVGHEAQHINSSDFKGFVKFQDDVVEYFAEKYPKLDNRRSRKQVQKLAHSFLNIVEDGRIEKILGNNLPGYVKYLKYLNLTLWENQEIKGNSEIEDFFSGVWSHAKLGVDSRKFGDFHTDTEVRKTLDAVIPFIREGVDARTAKMCIDATWKVVKGSEDFISRLLIENAQDTQDSVDHMSVINEFTTSEESQFNDSTESSSVHIKPQKKKEEEKTDDSSEKDEKTQSKSKISIEKEKEKEKEGEEESSRTKSSKEDVESEESSSKSTSDEGESEDQSDSKDSVDSDSGTDEGEEENESSDGSNGDEDDSEEQTEENDSASSGSNKSESEEEDGESSDSLEDSDSDEKGESLKNETREESDDEDSKADEKSDVPTSNKDLDPNHVPEGMEEEDEELDEEKIREFLQALTKEVELDANEKLEGMKHEDHNQSNSSNADQFRLNEEELREIESLYRNDSNNKFYEEHELELRYSLPVDIKREGSRFRKEVERIFRNKEEYTLRGQRRGKLDVGNMHKLQVRDFNVMVKKNIPIQSDYVAFLLEDGSGSMNENEKYKASKQAISVMEEGLKGIIPFKIATFNTHRSTTVHNVVKGFHEDERSYNYAFNALVQRRPGGGNKDGMSIRVATKELLKRPERDRILIIFSDGLPSDYIGGQKKGMVDVKNAVKEARKAGIFVVSLLFGNESFRDLNIENYRYMYEKNIISCEPQMISNQLTKMLKKVIAH